MPSRMTTHGRNPATEPKLQLGRRGSRYDNPNQNPRPAHHHSSPEKQEIQ